MSRESLHLAIGIILSTAACSGSSSPPPVDLNDFTGAAWTFTDTVTESCDAGTGLQNGSSTVTLVASGSSGLTYTSANGCAFDFTVSGDTATLSNGPVTCSGTSGSLTAVTSFTSFTLSTSDGAHMTGMAGGTVTVGGIECPFSATVSGTR